MNNHGKKIIAPVAITCLLAAYMVMFFLFIIKLPMHTLSLVLVGGAPLAILFASVYVLIERIKEIRSGEEDDLGKY